MEWENKQTHTAQQEEKPNRIDNCEGCESLGIPEFSVKLTSGSEGKPTLNMGSTILAVAAQI